MSAQKILYKCAINAYTVLPRCVSFIKTLAIAFRIFFNRLISPCICLGKHIKEYASDQSRILVADLS